MSANEHPSGDPAGPAAGRTVVVAPATRRALLARGTGTAAPGPSADDAEVRRFVRRQLVHGVALMIAILIMMIAIPVATGMYGNPGLSVPDDLRPPWTAVVGAVIPGVGVALVLFVRVAERRERAFSRRHSDRGND